MPLLDNLQLVEITPSCLANRDWLTIKLNNTHIQILEPDSTCGCGIEANYISGDIEVYKKVAQYALRTAALRAGELKVTFHHEAKPNCAQEDPS